MANQIRFKRASGSDPGASDIAVGEPAVRTDTGELFFKKDDGSVAKISGGGISDGDKGDITVSNSGGTFTIDNDAVTYAKIQNVSATNRILGRDSSGAGVIEEITPANLRTMINVEDGATADQSASEIVALIADQTIAPSTIDMEDDERIKLGASDDLLIYHDSNSFVRDVGGGNLCLDTNGTKVQIFADGTSSKTMANFLKDDAVELYYNGNKKFETSNTGGTITGTLVATAFTGALTGNVTGNASGSSGSCTGNAATATALETARNIGGVSFDGTANINLPGVNTSGNQNTSGNAATATKLATARTIAGVSFDGSANISLNNNAITNGAGYITATLTNEQVQDIVGAMVSGNSESGITVTYQDSDGTLDFSVASQTDNNFTNADHSKLDGIAAGANVGIPTSGGEFTGDITTHDVIPDGNNTRDLGSSSARYANLFINDMHFANSADNPNKVDVTWGDWTLQEGEDSIYMLNNRNGKKYKMNLTEIV